MAVHKLYVATTPDRFELPICVADSPAELAEKMGVRKGTVLSVISHASAHKRYCTYRRVEYTEKEWRE